MADALWLMQTNEVGQALGLQVGDVLLAVNGVPFDGGPGGLIKVFQKARGTRLALTFKREEYVVVVLTDSPEIGQWKTCKPQAIDFEHKPLNPKAMENWEVYKNRDGVYDLQKLSPDAAALFWGPLWLAQMRLWVPLAGLIAGVMIALPTGWLMTVTVYVVGCIFAWRNSNLLFRTDRTARGFRSFVIYAGATEQDIHDGMKRIDPLAYYIHGEKPVDSNVPNDKEETNPQAA